MCLGTQEHKRLFSFIGYRQAPTMTATVVVVAAAAPATTTTTTMTMTRTCTCRPQLATSEMIAGSTIAPLGDLCTSSNRLRAATSVSCTRPILRNSVCRQGEGAFERATRSESSLELLYHAISLQTNNKKNLHSNAHTRTLIYRQIKSTGITTRLLYHTAPRRRLSRCSYCGVCCCSTQP